MGDDGWRSTKSSRAGHIAVCKADQNQSLAIVIVDMSFPLSPPLPFASSRRRVYDEKSCKVQRSNIISKYLFIYAVWEFFSSTVNAQHGTFEKRKSAKVIFVHPFQNRDFFSHRSCTSLLFPTESALSITNLHRPYVEHSSPRALVCLHVCVHRLSLVVLPRHVSLIAALVFSA